MKAFDPKRIMSSLVKRLTREELLERMRLCSTALAEEIYKIAQSQVAGEERREALLTSKSASLLAASGLSLTLVFTFGAALLEHPERLLGLGHVVAIAIDAAYFIALLCGLATGIMAIWSMRVTGDYREVAEQSVFHEEELRAADDMWKYDLLPFVAPKDDCEPVWQDRPSARYRRFMAVELWLVYQQNFAVHERKSRLIRRAQDAFAGFLLMLIFIGSILTLASYNAHSNSHFMRQAPVSRGFTTSSFPTARSANPRSTALSPSSNVLPVREPALPLPASVTPSSKHL